MPTSPPPIPPASQVFGMPAFQQHASYFRYLVFTTEDAGPNKRILRFSFALPPADKVWV
jgi:hypothetical protein